MRKQLFFASIAALLVACGDDPSSPVDSRSAASARNNSVATGEVSKNGKPVPETGFTKAISVEGSSVVIPAGDVKDIFASCPAGTTVVGGGHVIVSFSVAASPPLIVRSRDDGANGWNITVSNLAAASHEVTVLAVARCAS